MDLTSCCRLHQQPRRQLRLFLFYGFNFFPRHRVQDARVAISDKLFMEFPDSSRPTAASESTRRSSL